MKLVCPECKNEVDFSNYPSLSAGHVLECDQCGITLSVVSVENDDVVTEIVDEGK